MYNKIVDGVRLSLKKKYKKFCPVFLIGCGRSGTTILGSTLGKHPSITYLNERRDLWHKAYPDLDIWSGKYPTPKLIVDKNNNDIRKTKILKGLLLHEQVIDNGKILLEKLPVNNFRLDFINKAFPNAKYIYLHRNGLEVAKSIEKRVNDGTWYTGKHKWDLIEQLSNNHNISTENLSGFEKGLLEWRFSIDFSESFFSNLEKERFYSLSYQTFLENPKYQIENILKFMHLDFTDSLLHSMTEGIKRRSEKIQVIDDHNISLGGDHLKLSLANQLVQTAPNP